MEALVIEDEQTLRKEETGGAIQGFAHPGFGHGPQEDIAVEEADDVHAHDGDIAEA